MSEPVRRIHEDSSTPGLILSRKERQELVDVLSEISELREGSSSRQSFITIAGLSYLDLDYSGSSRVFAGRLIELTERAGTIPNQHTYHALGALLAYILELRNLSEAKKPLVAALLVRYSLVDEPSYLDMLRSKYGLNASATNPEPEQNNRINNQDHASIPSAQDAAESQGNYSLGMAKNLWTAYLIWLLVPLLGWLASATEVFELGACSRFSVATLLTLSGGFVLIANSLRSGNRNSYSNWDRWLTTAMTIVATASIAFLTLSSCTSPIPPDSYSYIVRVYDATTNTPFQEVVASVKVFVGGEKFEGNSGSDGIATVLIPNQYRNRQAQLEVTANGYQAHRDQAHSLNSDTHDVFLLRLEGTPTVPSTITSNQIEDTPPVMLEPNTIGPTPLPTSTTTPTLIVRVPPTPIIQPSPGVSTPLVQLSNTFPPPSPQDSENNGSTPTKSVEPAVPTPVPTSTLMPPEDVTPPTMAPLALNPLPTSPTSVTISPPPTLIAPELATPPLMPPESVTPTLISPESATPPLIQP